MNLFSRSRLGGALGFLALGLAPLTLETQAGAQELRFRAVPASEAAAIPTTAPPAGRAVSLAWPNPTDSALRPASLGSSVVRFKTDDPPLAPLVKPEPLKVLPGKTVPEPGGITVAPFVPPQPQPLNAPQGSTPPGSVQPMPGQTIITHGPAEASPWYTSGDPACCSSCNSCGTDACGSCRSSRSLFGNFLGHCGLEDCDSCGHGCGLFDGCHTGCCEPRDHMWVRGEYLLWMITRQRVPSLLIQTNNAVAPNQVVIGDPNTNIIVGDGDIRNEIHSGGRFSFGFWFPRHSDFGLDTSFFFLGQRDNHLERSGTANNTFALGRPFFEVRTDVPGVVGEASELVSFPGLLNGTLSVDYATRLYGGDINLRKKLCCGPNFWLDGMLGYRYTVLSDDLTIREDLVALNPDGSRTNFVVTDSFSTRNQFHGAQIGLEGECKIRRIWFIGGYGKVALGNVHQTVDINGQSFNSVTGSSPVGLYGMPTNNGRYERNRFAVMPEFGLKVGVNVTDHLRLYAGYSAMYLSNVVRAGDQIDRVVNTSQLPVQRGGVGQLVGPARPAVLFKTSDFWASGVNFGAELHY